MAISREEQLRNNRRFSRQIVGAVAIVLIIIGLFTVLSWVVGVLRSALDDTERRQSYADRLYGLVMFDTMPFDDVSKVDQSEFLQAAIWGAVYQIQKRDNGLSDYERDSETGSIILPKLEVDTYLTNLLGPKSSIIPMTRKSRAIWFLLPAWWLCIPRKWKRFPPRAARPM